MISSNFQLLKIKEKIEENLAGNQIAKTLDDLLFNCLKPIIFNTNFMEYVLVELLPHIFLNQRRKFSNKSLDDLRDAIFSFIMTDNDEEKMKLLRKQGLERSIYIAALQTFEVSAQQYLEETETQLENIANNKPYDDSKLKKIRKMFYPRKDFYETSQSTIFWLNNIYKFRAMIVEKYVRHAYVESIKMTKATDLNIEQEDLFRNLIINIHKAIDKYDAEKGPLTSYIDRWFLEAKTNVKNIHEIGVAYSIPTSQRKKLLEEGKLHNFTLELNDEIAESIKDDKENALDNMIGSQNNTIMHNIACHADTDKMYVITQDIVHTLNSQDLNLQRQTLLPISEKEHENQSSVG
jgi:hypothetical protein